MTRAFADASKRFRRWSLLLEGARLSALSHLKAFIIQYSTFYECQFPKN